MGKGKSSVKGVLICVFVAFIWGVSFSAQDISGDYMGPFAFTSIRYFFAFVTTLAAMVIFERRAEDRAKVTRSVMSGVLCGAVMFCGVALQQCSIKVSGESGKAGFITSLYIIAVPLLGLFVRRYPKMNVWGGVVLATAGMFLLTFKESGGGLSLGEILVLVSVIFWSLHIILIGKFANDVYPIRFSMVQFLTCSAMGAWAITLGADGAFGFSEPSVTAFFGTLPPAICLVYSGFISVGLGYTLQAVAQKSTDPVSASLALSLESVFAVFAQTVIQRDPLGYREYIGCLVIFCGIILSQLPGEWFSLGKHRSSKKGKEHENRSCI